MQVYGHGVAGCAQEDVTGGGTWMAERTGDQHLLSLFRGRMLAEIKHGREWRLQLDCGPHP